MRQQSVAIGVLRSAAARNAINWKLLKSQRYQVAQDVEE
jgi:hypothetical protein